MERRITRATVRGGSGFIGSRLVKRLAEAGCEVMDSPADAELLYDVAGSIGPAESVGRPEASAGDREASLQFFADAGPDARRVFVSSRRVYGRTGTEAADEERRPAPRTPYAEEKLAVERALAEHADFVVLRVSNAYGHDAERRRRGFRVLDHFIRESLRGRPIRLFGDGSQLRDFVHVDDVVEALLAAGRVPAAGRETFNIGGGEPRTLRDAAEKIRELSGGPPIEYVAWPSDYARAETGGGVLEIAKARRVLGFSPRIGFEDGLRRTLEEYRRG